VSFPILPPQASSTARQVDALCIGLLTLCGLVLLGLLLVIVYFLFRYRRAKNVPRSRFRGPTVPLELTWTIIPALLFTGLFGWGATVYRDQQIIPKTDLELYVTGKQWMWKVQHPNGRREIDEMHLPLGKTVKATLASEDVIHSFFVPAFRIKQDVVPGRLTTEWFQPTRAGTYHIFCAEYCGKDHSRMRGKIVVMDPAEYDRWLASGTPSPSLAQAGEQLFRTLGCSGCHQGSSIVRAPPLNGLFGRATPLQSGQVILADEAYIRDSILLPARDVAAGYQPVMPSYRGQITEEQIFQLIAYIKSLGAPQTGTQPK
jgi:cytochrome c oxidase subunit 2